MRLLDLGFALEPLVVVVVVAGALIASPSTAIGVAPSSPCAVQCGNVLSSTTGSDVVCGDSSYGSLAGQTFAACVGCELNSAYVDATTQESDLQWLLYNLRYAASWCLFGYPNNTNVADTPCTTSFACGSFQSALEHDGPAANASQYEYCASWPSNPLAGCQNCLAQLGNEQYLSNFFTALEAACEQRPAAASTIALSGSLFATTPVNITTPTPSSSVAGISPSTGRLSLGGAVGIALGGAVVIITVVGCCIIWRGKRRRRAALARLATTNMSPTESRHGFMAPGGARAHAWRGNSPQSAAGEAGPILATAGGFSPYQSPYQSPVSPDAAADSPVSSKVRDKGKACESPDAAIEMVGIASAGDGTPISRPPAAQ